MIADLREIDAKNIILIDVGCLDSLEAPADRKAEERHLKRWENELEQEETEISIDPHKVLPGQSEDVVGMRDVAVWICGAPAGVGGCRHP